jgi:hypothetical protein
MVTGVLVEPQQQHRDEHACEHRNVFENLQRHLVLDDAGS